MNNFFNGLLSGKNIVLAALVVALLLLALFFSSPSDFRSHQQKDFDSIAWQEGSPIQRASMAESLVNSDTLEGLNYRAVERLLGTPDTQHEMAYIYELDFGHSWWPGERWSYHFNVHFDSSGTVYHYGYSD